MIKKYEVRIISRDVSDPSLTKFDSIDTIESDNLIHLYQQVGYRLMKLMERHCEMYHIDRSSEVNDDDIPF